MRRSSFAYPAVPNDEHHTTAAYASGVSLAPDVYLTALDDRGRLQTEGSADIALAGALVIGDLLGGRSLRDLVGFDGDPAESIGNRTRGVVSIVASQAVATGLVRIDEYRLLGLLPRRRHVVADTGTRDRLVRQLTDALVPGARPERDVAAFALVCAISGIARRWVPPSTVAEERAVLAGQVNSLSEIAGEAVTTIVAAMRSLYGRAGAQPMTDAGMGVAPFAFVLLATDGSDDYGDTNSGGGGNGWYDGTSGSDGGGDGGGGGGGGGE